VVENRVEFEGLNEHIEDLEYDKDEIDDFVVEK